MYRSRGCWNVDDLFSIFPFDDLFTTIKSVPLPFLDEVVISHKLINWVAYEPSQLLLNIFICEFYLD